MLYTLGIAFAQGQQSQGGSPMSGLTTLIPIVLMIVVFWFLLIRPQQKKEKERKSMITSLQKGDKVLTSGGIYGVVDSFKENEVVVLKIGSNTKAEFAKNAIQGKVS